MEALDLLRQQIDTCEVAHSHYTGELEFLTRRIREALRGWDPAIEVIVGPSRVGKSTLITALTQLFPETRIDGRRQVGVLMVKISKAITMKMLPWVFLKALNVPIPPRANEIELKTFLTEQLRLAGTRVILVEEASKFVEEGSKVLPRGIADWLFELSDDAKVSIFLFGVPRLRRLVDSNEQFVSRASKTREFRPYDTRDTKQMQGFAAVVRTYMDMFKHASYPIELELSSFAANCYLLSGGALGEVATFMRKLIDQLHGQQSRSIVLKDCQNAVRCMNSAGDPQFPPFAKLDVQPPELLSAHVALLRRAGMDPLVASPRNS